jgi:hypothetical protein
VLGRICQSIDFYFALLAQVRGATLTGNILGEVLLSLDLCAALCPKTRPEACPKNMCPNRARRHSFSGTLDDPEKLTFAPEIETHRSRMPKAR